MLQNVAIGYSHPCNICTVGGMIRAKSGSLNFSGGRTGGGVDLAGCWPAPYLLGFIGVRFDEPALARSADVRQGLAQWAEFGQVTP